MHADHMHADHMLKLDYQLDNSYCLSDWIINESFRNFLYNKITKPECSNSFRFHHVEYVLENWEEMLEDWGEDDNVEIELNRSLVYIGPDNWNSFGRL